MSRDPLAAAKARKAEQRADEKSGGITIKPVVLPPAGGKSSTGFKKGGFKNAFGNADEDDEKKKEDSIVKPKAEAKVEGFKLKEVEVESDTDEGNDYDPSKPTGCGMDCPGRH